MLVLEVPPRVADESDHHVVGLWNNIVYTVWRQETTTRGIRAIERVVREHDDGPLLALSVVTDQATMPPGEVREQLARVMLSFGQKVARSALVFEGTGFRAAAVRSVVSGISLVRPMPYPHRVFDRAESGLMFLREASASHPALDFPIAGALDALDMLRYREPPSSLKLGS
ncbi:MAG TPA: hypothetical protein DEF51_36955 [Myxococcales bacterium]|nr:hypothetical protein [Myxococcales bacterium]